MLSYAGVPLREPIGDLHVLLARWWDEHAPDLWTTPGYSPTGLDTVPTPWPPTNTRARFNTLVWPNGAGRWGIFHGLVDSDGLARIVAATGSISPTAQTLTLSDPVSGGTVSVQMGLVAARPVYVVGARGLNWITLVDSRYYYWMRDNIFTFNDGDSWSTLLTNLVSAAAGLGVSVPAISGAYFNPSFERWNALQGRPLPLLIDAAAACCGLRFVASLDGTLKFAAADAAITDQSNQSVTLAPNLVMGGLNAAADVVGNVPAAVKVAFWRTTAAIQTPTLAGLALAQYGTITGVANATAWLVGDQPAGTTSSYGDRYATDYYLWSLSLLEATYRSIQSYNPTGMEDRVEWEYLPLLWKHGDRGEREGFLDAELPRGRGVTRVVRANFGDRNLYGTQQCCVEIVLVVPGARNADGDYPGIIQVFDPGTDSWINSDRVWIRDAN